MFVLQCTNTDITGDQCLYITYMQVEMFAVTADKTGCESDDALSDFVNIEQHLFEQLGLHFRFALSELDWLTVG